MKNFYYLLFSVFFAAGCWGLYNGYLMQNFWLTAVAVLEIIIAVVGMKVNSDCK